MKFILWHRRWCVKAENYVDEFGLNEMVNYSGTHVIDPLHYYEPKNGATIAHVTALQGGGFPARLGKKPSWPGLDEENAIQGCQRCNQRSNTLLLCTGCYQWTGPDCTRAIDERNPDSSVERCWNAQHDLCYRCTMSRYPRRRQRSAEVTRPTSSSSGTAR